MDKINPKILLDLANKYNNLTFIANDPISIPHGFTKKADIELSAFLISIISWGKRDQIILKSKDLMNRMGNSPTEFLLNFNENDLESFKDWKYRTFNFEDLSFFLKRLKSIIEKHKSIENYFQTFINPQEDHYSFAISRFKEDFFTTDPTIRTTKHLPNPLKGSAAKRFHMYLRWMVRKDKNGVDFGIWNKLDIKKLSCPLDTHTGRIAREFNLITRKQNDFKTLQELDEQLRIINPSDPALLDYALFGYGIENPKKKS